MNSVGEILRTRRQTQGRDVTDIAAALCIVSNYVCSIEQDDLKALPNVFFYKSFVKQYAAAVGLDYVPLRASVEALAALEEPPVLRPADSRCAIGVRACDRLQAWFGVAQSKVLHFRKLLLHSGKIAQWAPDREL